MDHDSSGLTHSETLTAFAKALVKAQAAFKPLVKDQTAEVQTKTGRNYKYGYADLASAIAVVVPALGANGLVVIQAPWTNLADASVAVDTMLLHESGEWVRDTFTLRPSDATPQGFGSAVTYARRYALLSMCGIAPEEDDDGAKASGKDAASKNGAAKPEKIAVDDVLLRYAKATKADPEDDAVRARFKAWLASFGVTAWSTENSQRAWSKLDAQEAEAERTLFAVEA